VLAAQSLLTRLKRMQELPNDKFLLWGAAHASQNRNLAAVAVAAKLARIAWAVEAKGKTYIPRPQLNRPERVACKDRKMA